jgi:hypothetical protein
MEVVIMEKNKLFILILALSTLVFGDGCFNCDKQDYYAPFVSDIWYYGKDKTQGFVDFEIYLLDNGGMLEFAAINRGFCEVPIEIFNEMYPNLANLERQEIRGYGGNQSADIYFNYIATQAPDLNIDRVKEIFDEFYIPAWAYRIVILKFPPNQYKH